MDVLFVRLLVSPALPAAGADALADALKPAGDLLGPVADSDLNCTLISVRLRQDDLARTIQGASEALRAFDAGRVFRFELQGVFTDADARASTAIGETIAQTLRAPTYVAQRVVPVSVWRDARPLRLGVDGFSLRSIEPSYAHAHSRAVGAVVEFSAPTILIKVELPGIPASALGAVCDAVGSPRGGLMHVGAAPGVSIKTGAAFALLECSDHVKSPLARALDLFDIEAKRYGGAVGGAALLSYIPLDALLQTLTMRMPLDAKPGQIIETRLDSARS